MIVERLSLANFRGFDQLDLAFDERVTLLEGINGVGKSGVLYALARLLSRALPQYTRSKVPPTAFSDEDIQVGAGAMQVSATLSVEGVSLVGSLQRVVDDAGRRERITRHGEQLRSKLDATTSRTERRRLQREIKNVLSALDEDGDQFTLVLGEVSTQPIRTGGLEAVDLEAQRRLDQLRASKRQPVAVFYSTARAIKGQPRTLMELEPYELSRAYEGALTSEGVLLSDVMNWFYLQESEYGGAAGVRVLDKLREVVRDFAPSFTDLRVESGPPPRFVVTKDGVRLDLRMLSDGERSLLALMFDLTRRLTLANQDEPDPITNGRAVVLVDEIELHLHPAWQRNVLRTLTDTFKACQFIATTHSPQVLGEVKPSSIWRLRPGQPAEQPERSFGMDSNAVLRRIQHVPIRTARADELVNLIDQLVDHDRLDDARERLGELATVVGDDDTEVIRLGTMLDILQTAE